MSDEGWLQTTWGDVLTLQRGFDITRAEQNLGGDVPVVSSGGILSQHNVPMVNGPGVVIGRKGSLGTVHYVDRAYWPHDTTLWVKDFKGNYPRFVYYALKTLRIEHMNVGSASPTLNRNHVHPMPVKWPRIFAAQRAIAEVLGALDDKIAANRAVIDAARDLAVSIVSQFSELTTVDQLSTLRRATVKPEDFGSAPVVHLSLPAFDAGQSLDLVDPTEIKSAKFSVKSPSVLVSKLNPRFPRVWDLPKLPQRPVLASTEFVVLEPDAVSTSLLAALVSQPTFFKDLEGRVAGTSGSHQRVKPADIMSSRVPDPGQMPAGVAQMVTALGEQIAARKIENEQLAATRDGLLPLLMSGKVRVKDAEKTVGEMV